MEHQAQSPVLRGPHPGTGSAGQQSRGRLPKPKDASPLCLGHHHLRPRSRPPQVGKTRPSRTAVWPVGCRLDECWAAGVAHCPVCRPQDTEPKSCWAPPWAFQGTVFARTASPHHRTPPWSLLVMGGSASLRRPHLSEHVLL